MRTFATGSASDRKVVTIDRSGSRLTVLRVMPDGSNSRKEQEMPSEAAAIAASDRLAQDLLSRGYTEQRQREAKPARPARAATRPAKPQKDEEEAGGVLYDLVEEAAPAPAPVLTRLTPPPVAEAAASSSPKKKKKKSKKRKKDSDELDKRVIAAVAGVGVLLALGACFIVYDYFIKPPSIVGSWRGGMTEYEVGGPIIRTAYELMLDDKKRAQMTLDKSTSIGTYSVKGNRLKLTFKGDEGEAFEKEYKIVLGRATLELKEPETGKLLVQLIRFRDPPLVGQPGAKPKAEDEGPAAPTDAILSDLSKVDKDAEAKLASLPFSAQDGAFRLRYPEGWTPTTGSRSDNTYSWVKLTKDSVTIDVNADVKGSLLSGSDSAGQYEEGSELAPVHRAHEQFKKEGSDLFSDFVDSKPALFKGAELGEGRLSMFTANSGGLFGSKLRGYHVTMLTRDRRVTILCQCPENDFPKLKSTFIAVCRSLGR
jgi:hypothetical protein